MAPPEPKGTLFEVQTGLTQFQQLQREALRDKVRQLWADVTDADFEAYIEVGFQHVCRVLWDDESSLWSVRADWFVEEVHERNLAGGTVEPRAKRPNKFGPPFSKEVLQWCYGKALDSRALYLMSPATFEPLTVSGRTTDDLGKVDFGALRHKDRKVIFKSVEGLAHDGQVYGYYGTIWIPNRGPGRFTNSVGSDDKEVDLALDQAAKFVCGDKFILLLGQLTNGHKALMLELKPGTDIQNATVRTQYQRGFIDLLAWQMELLRGRPAKIAEFVQGRQEKRRKEGGPNSFGSPDERKALVRQYWTEGQEGNEVLLLAQQAAMRSVARDHAKTVLHNVEKRTPAKEGLALFDYVAGDHMWRMLPLSQRQAHIKLEAEHNVRQFVVGVMLDAGERDDMTSVGPILLALAGASDSSTRGYFDAESKYATFAEILSGRDRYKLIAGFIESGTFSDATKGALKKIEKELGLLDVED
ncbi:hypothetical protein PG985_014786 [Apiospora marii]|uniref:uncharacterized protein n=1 Tax=Apiospora marii TaxID=335849 RepID=UPI00312F2418